MTDGEVAVPRDAATLILVRTDRGAVELLMGVRSTRAAFMPQRRVFPGGALDSADLSVPMAGQLAASCVHRLIQRTERPELAVPLALAAIRETFEETGLAIGTDCTSGLGTEVPAGSWQEFFARGLIPTPGRLRFILRAITPVDYSIRFDARFFLAMADAVAGDIDDLSGASGELHELQWIPAAAAARLSDLPFITRVAIAEVEQILATEEVDRPVPMYAEGRHTATVVKL